MTSARLQPDAAEGRAREVTTPSLDPLRQSRWLRRAAPDRHLRLFIAELALSDAVLSGIPTASADAVPHLYR